MNDGFSVATNWLITAADGYIDLKMSDHAARELAKVPEELHASAPYRWVMCRLLMLQEHWGEARDVAEGLCADQPDESASWITFAYATRRSAGLSEARDILLSGMPRFPGEGIFPYNLACYACQSGELDGAREFLKAAVFLEAGFRELALEDEDLEALRAEVESRI